MGLFNKKDKEVVLERAPLGYWEEESYMIAIPRQMDINILKEAGERIASTGAQIKSVLPPTEESPLRFIINYEGEDYAGGMYVSGFSLPQMCGRQDFYFTKEEWEELNKAEIAVTVFLKFNKDAKKSFHLQLKLVNALVPDLIGVMDESAERMLCPRWVKMAANSSITPGPKDMYIIHAISDEDGSVWLHTHGLLRCGVSEIEIVASDTEHYKEHGDLLNAFACRLLDKKEDEFIPKETTYYLGELEDDTPVVTTYVPWNEAMSEYNNLSVGGIEDRKEGHNSLTSFVFLYTSEHNEKNHILTKVDEYNDKWANNPIYFFSNEETNRMRNMARERFDFVKKALNGENHILVKIGLQMDDADEGDFEHIWFELNEFDGDRFKATLTQDPYRLAAYKAGDVDYFTVNEVTDWIIYTPQFAITPDKAYLLS